MRTRWYRTGVFYSLDVGLFQDSGNDGIGDFRGLIARLDGARLSDDRLALSRAVIYLPTRRAARGFGEAFAEALGGSALLPQFRALGDSEEDELVFDAISEGADLPPAIDPLLGKPAAAQVYATQSGGSVQPAAPTPAADPAARTRPRT